MKSNISLLFLAVLISATVCANPISENQARSIAANFMAQQFKQAPSLTLGSRSTRIGTTGNTAYYVFNSSRQGYVIVAGDDRAPAVLGYSENGTFNSESVPPAMQELLDSYAEQMAAIDAGAKTAPRLTAGRAISPLVKATWSQNNPYNILLPYIPSGKHAYVGCVATAMAQVLHYWKWPATTTQPIPAYTSESLSIAMLELPVTTFDWDSMQDTYLTTDTNSVAALAAAKLSLYCAQAVEMDFKKTSSGAQTASIPIRLASYFDYDPSAHMESRHNYSTQGWADLLYSELAAGRPVIYSGSKATGGHAFICDGYDGNGLFHINWGWNAMSNGYFLLNVLNPDEQGTGSADGAYGYIFSQGALVGIQPNKGGSHVFELTASMVTLNSYTGTRSYTSDPFKAVVTGRFHNYTSDTLAINFGWGLFQDGTLISTLSNSYNTSLRPGYHHTHTAKELSFGANLTSGTYRILPMYSEYNMNNWRPCVGSDRNYIEVTIDGNNCTFTGYGTAGERNYTINDIAVTGYLHNGRPVNIDLNMTNNGSSSNEILYMFVNGTFAAAGFVSLEPGETGNIHYTYLFENTGDYTLTWSWNENGNDPIASRTVTIDAMPAANLSASINVLNVSDAANKIITDNKFSIQLTITNNGSTTYDEDISVKLYKNIYSSTGSTVQGMNKHVTIASGQTATVQFDMDNVIDGWKYFVKSYYYSSGTQKDLKGSTTYTIVFPEEPVFTPGDVNNDNAVNIKDVTDLIDYLLSGSGDINELGADVMADGSINIADVTALIDMLLTGH